MALIATLTGQFNNHLRYLLEADSAGGTVVIPSVGGASPDLQTDSLAGPIKIISKVQQTGLGNIPAGPVSVGQARSLLLSDNTMFIGGPEVPRTIVTAVGRSGINLWLVSAIVSGGSPAIQVICPANQPPGSSAYLDIEVFGAIGS